MTLIPMLKLISYFIFFDHRIWLLVRHEQINLFVYLNLSGIFHLKRQYYAFRNSYLNSPVQSRKKEILPIQIFRLTMTRILNGLTVNKFLSTLKRHLVSIIFLGDSEIREDSDFASLLIKNY
ncbi:hypothetical protein BpHYR1_006709 [Brachionus plicatilis]|uniref:Uncharacterized protein n=1 Tax=Brachionus plicatilis TaxID=10195 RepID=A0A3M7RR40_BRAPC|nr:hypothetical protein BpHYR1_006709 [Brachionus plicatilis]